MRRFQALLLLVAATSGCGSSDHGNPDANVDSGDPGRGDVGPAAPARLTLSDVPAFDFGTHALGSSNDHVFVVTNTGGTAAGTLTASGLAPPFALKNGVFPGIGGTCSASLGPANACTVVVTFSPTQATASAGLLALSYDDGVAAQMVTVSLSGTGTTGAALSISDGPTFDFGVHAVGSTTDHTFTVANTGMVAATNLLLATLAAPFAPKDGAYPGTGGTCGKALVAGATCTLVVSFTPTAAGAQNAVITFAYDDGAGVASLSRAVQGTGATPALVSISDGVTYDFGVVAVGSSADHTFTVTNAGSLGASGLAGSGLAASFAWKDGTYPGTGGDCGATLAPLASCKVVVTFRPVAIGGSNGMFVLAFNDGGSAQMVSRPLKGTGAAPALVSVSDGPEFDFGTHATNTTTEKTFTLTNTGGVAAVNLAAAAGLGNGFDFKGGAFPGDSAASACGSRLSVQQSCTIVVTFRPTVIGPATSIVSVGYASGAGNQVASRVVKGTGTQQAFLTIVSTGPSSDFGTAGVGSSIDKVFIVTNSGALAATAIVVTPLGVPFSIPSDDCNGGSLAPSASCSITIRYRPMVAGPATATLSVGYSDGTNPQTAVRSLSGRATDQAFLAVSDGPAYDYGLGAIGSATDHIFTVTNTGAADATAVAVAALAVPFAIKAGGNCGATLAASASCTVVVTFAPVAGGPFSAALSVGYNDGVAVQTATRAVNGAGAAAAQVSISDGPTYDYGTRLQGLSTDHAFTVINAGGVAATGLSAAMLGTPFTFAGGDIYPGAGGNCGALLAPADACTIVVTFRPTGLGMSSATLGLQFNDGSTMQTASRPMIGMSAPAALLAISDGPTYDFGALVVGARGEHTFTVTNLGGVTATNLAGVAPALSPPFSWKGGSFPGMGGDCMTGLLAGGSCKVVVAFAPDKAGVTNDAFAITYNNGGGAAQATRNLTGGGLAPAVLSISDGPTYDYGTRPVGSATDHTFTVTHAGSIGATSVAAIALPAGFNYKDGQYPGTGGNCKDTVPVGGSCMLVVTFAPGAAGSSMGALSLGYFDGFANQVASRALAGNAIVPAALSLSDTAHDFGTVAQYKSADHALLVTNTGGVIATGIAPSGLSSPFGFKGTGYPGVGGTCGATLAPGASCGIWLAFSPSALGPANATLVLSYNDGVTAQMVSEILTGKGTNLASLAITDFPPLYYSAGITPDGATFDFGAIGVGRTAGHTFYVTNTGAGPAANLMGAALSPSVFAYAGGGAAPGAGGSCGPTLAAGSTCTLVVGFTPSAAVTTSSSVGLTYDDGMAGQQIMRALQGTGSNGAALRIYDLGGGGGVGVDIGPWWDYGTMGIGQPNEHQFVVVNNGKTNATALVGGAFGAAFSFKGGTFPGQGGTCTSPIPPGSVCSVNVVFKPVAIGPVADTVAVGYFDGSAQQSATRPVKGTGTDRALLLIAGKDGPFPVVDFGTRGVGSYTDVTLNVMNLGAVAATAMAVPTAAAPFSIKSNGCGASLVPGAGCTLVVTFHPLAAGTVYGAVNLDYNDGAATVTATRALTGTGTSRALLVITDYNGGGFNDPTPYNFGTTAGTTTHTFYVANQGAQDATGLVLPALALPFSVANNGCPSTLPAGANCQISVTFAPLGGGSFGATLRINYTDTSGGQTANRDLVGFGSDDALITISDCQNCGGGGGGGTPSPYDFGVVGSPVNHAFTLVNNGAKDATALALSGLAGAFAVTGNTCASTLAKGAMCQVTVTFTPTGTATSLATLIADYADSNGAQPSATRTMTGTGTLAAVLSIADCQNCGSSGGSNPSPYDFGTTGTSVTRTFFVSNTGAQDATSVGTSGLSQPFSVGTNTCGPTIAKGVTCQITVTFAPMASGTYAQILNVNYSDASGARPPATRAVTGRGTSNAILSIADCQNCGGSGNNPQPYDFGTWGRPVTRTFYVTNVGVASATGVTVGGLSQPYSVSASDCGAGPITPGGTCTFSVTFNPPGSGKFLQTVTVNYGDGSGVQPPVSRGLSATGTSDAVLAIADCPNCGGGGGSSKGPIDLGTSGIPITHQFYLTNNGAQDASVIVLGGLGMPFSISSNNCPSTLATGASCDFTVQFSPPAGAGTFTQTLSVSFSDANGAQPPATQGVSASGTANALLLVRDCDFCGGGGGGGGAPPPYDFGTWGVATTHTFGVTNAGALDATMLSFTGLSSPFSVVGNTCGTSIGKGASCSITVQFKPTGTGIFTQTLTVGYSDSAGGPFATKRDLTGTGTNRAVIEIQDPCCSGGGGPYAFGTTGVPVVRTFTIANHGGGPTTNLSVTGLSPPFSGTTTCGAVLASGASCTVTVTFNPGTGGTFNQTLTVNASDAVGVLASTTRALTGAGTTRALLTIDDGCCGGNGGGGPWDFGTWGIGNPISASHTFNVSNVGGADTTVLSLSGLSPPFSATTNCGSVIVRGAPSCTVTVTFNPTMAQGISQTFRLDYSDAGGALPPATRAVTGAGTAAPLLVIQDFMGTPQPSQQPYSQPYDYGVWGYARVREFWIYNVGGGPALSLGDGGTLGSGFALVGGFPGQNQGGVFATCGGALAPGAGCSVRVTFTPPASNGVQSSVLSVGYQDGGTPRTITRGVSGTSTTRAHLVVTPFGLDDCGDNCGPVYFGAFAQGQSSPPWTFTVYNTGAALASGMSFAPLGSYFAASNNLCGMTLGSQGVCTLNVVFSPQGIGTFGSAVNISYNDSVSAGVTANRNISGTGN